MGLLERRPPRIILLPGLHGSASLFAPLLRAAPGGLELEPRSLPSSGPQSYAGLAERITLPRRERHVLVAESFSGPLALRLAADPPPGLCAVVLVNSFVSSPLTPGQTLLATLGAPWAFAGVPPAAVVRRLLLGDDAPAALVAAVQQAIRELPRRVGAERLRTVFMANEAIAYCRSHVPMFYLQAEQDRVLGPGPLQTLIRLRPGLQLKTLPGPHLLLQRQPRRCMLVLQEILRQLA